MYAHHHEILLLTITVDYMHDHAQFQLHHTV